MNASYLRGEGLTYVHRDVNDEIALILVDSSSDVASAKREVSISLAPGVCRWNQARARRHLPQEFQDVLRNWR